MQFYCVNGSIQLPDGRVVQGHALCVEHGRIAAITDIDDVPPNAARIDLAGNLLAPGFVDLQANGGGGVLFNDNPSVDALRVIAQAQSRFGTTAFLPTLISDDLDKIRVAIGAVNDAIALGVAGVIGIHLEGPFLNADRKGIHDAQKIRRMTDGDIDAILRHKPVTTLVTLAPELVSDDQLHRLKSGGVLLCAGHTDGSFEEITASFAAGVDGVTHLFNAMSPLRARAPGAVGAALADPDCWCCIIVDGEHVHPETLKLAFRAKGSLDRFILVTDAMPTVGQSDKEFILNGERISAKDGVCKNADGTLAGSDLDMARAVQNCVDLLGMERARAVELATLNPARFLRAEKQFGTLQVGLAANMVELRADGVVRRTWINGALVWDEATGCAPVAIAAA
ncbi:MAG: N-acetylglucosamine-6-phosphate deacetylase [Alphaproteobacteria bacterium HGW-Alphaproteobacteria-16]|nr:MAG: N-acetylglucosamine-6-phosphate deacetylase [Alphaproteobacteria bacterium HGW-Alphaproteobacteria-16]